MQPVKPPQEQPEIEKLGPDDVVLQQRKPTPRNVDVDHANRVPDRNWEIGSAEDQLEASRAPQAPAKKPG